MIAKSGKRVLSLSLDSGGSYTDAVVMDISSKEVIAKVKSKTTHDDMVVGMMEAMNELILQRTFNPRDIRFVGLSTTLATNSILESKGGKVGLIRMGWDQLPDTLLPTVKDVYVEGGFDSKGKALAGISNSALVTIAKDMEGIADCIVISSKFACLKDSHEKMAKQVIAEHVKIPVIAAHELSTEMGVHERTNTAILNGMLLPVIEDFIQGVSSLLARYKINAKMMMMKGDGTVMRIETAKTRPVETIMSGPAASVVGGQALSGQDTCVVIDVGSTSTDIAVMRNGLPPINKEGAVILGKRTHVKNMDVHTIALGGDSHIQFVHGDITAGPKRAVPLSVASAEYPNILKMLKQGNNSSFIIPHKIRTRTLNENEQAIVDWVRENAPCTPDDIYKSFPRMHTARMVINSLMAMGTIIMTGLTPTDLMVIRGDFNTGCKEASILGLSIESSKAGMTPEQYSLKIMNHISAKIGRAIIGKIIYDETKTTEFGINASKIMDAAAGKGDLGVLDVKVRLDMPVVGLGGPAKIFLTSLGPRFDTNVIIPENYDVGNAMGTVHSKVADTSYVTILPSDEGGYEMKASFQNVERSMYIDDAIEIAIKAASEHSIKNVEKAGGINITVNVDTIRIDPKDADGMQDVMKIRARAAGDPMGHLVGYLSA